MVDFSDLIPSNNTKQSKSSVSFDDLIPSDSSKVFDKVARYLADNLVDTGVGRALLSDEAQALLNTGTARQLAETGKDPLGAGLTALGGYSFGTADEVAGLVSPKARDYIRQRQKRFAKNAPTVALGLELASGVKAPFVKEASQYVKSGKTLGSRLGRSSLTGGGSAGIYGAATGEGAQDRKDRALTSGAGGLLLGPAAQYVTEKAAIPAVARMTQPKQRPISKEGKILGSTFEDQQMQKAMAGIEQGTPETTFADVAGAKGQRFARNLSRTSDEAGEIIEANLEKRSAGEFDRVQQEISKVTKQDFNKSIDDVVEEGKKSARPLYEKAYESVKDFSVDKESTPSMAFSGAPGRKNYIKSFASTDRGKQVISNAKDVYNDDVAKMVADGADPVTVPLFDQMSDTKKADYIKRSFDRLIDAQIDPIKGLSEKGVRLQEIKSKFLNKVDEINPDYKKAREASGDYISIRMAEHAGKKIGNKTPAEISKSVAKMSPQEKKAFIVGLKEKLIADAAKASDTGSATRRIFGSKFKRDQVKAAIGDSFDEFEGTIKRELDFAKTQQRVSGGSRTDLNMSGNKMGNILSAIGSPIRGAAEAIGDRISNKYLGLTPERAEKMARALFGGNKEDAEKLLREALAYQLRRQTGGAIGVPSIGAGISLGRQE